MSEQLSIAIHLIDSVLKDPNLDQAHRHALDHVVTILFHQGVVRDEEDEKKEPVRTLLKEFQERIVQLASRFQWSPSTVSDLCNEFAGKFFHAGVDDINHCLNYISANRPTEGGLIGGQCYILRMMMFERILHIAHQRYGISLVLPAC